MTNNYYQNAKKYSERKNKHMKNIKIFQKKKKKTVKSEKRPEKDIEILLKKKKRIIKNLSEEKQTLVEYRRIYYLTHEKKFKGFLTVNFFLIYFFVVVPGYFILH